jgi:hypothetical protein
MYGGWGVFCGLFISASCDHAIRSLCHVFLPVVFVIRQLHKIENLN